MQKIYCFFKSLLLSLTRRLFEIDSHSIHNRKEAEADREKLLASAQAARADAERAAESIRRQQSVTDSALAPLPLDALLRETLGRVRELLEADAAPILLLAEDGQSLVVSATIGLEDEVIGMRIPVGPRVRPSHSGGGAHGLWTGRGPNARPECRLPNACHACHQAGRTCRTGRRDREPH
jgi:hypothetical protein